MEKLFDLLDELMLEFHVELRKLEAELKELGIELKKENE